MMSKMSGKENETSLPRNYRHGEEWNIVETPVKDQSPDDTRMWNRDVPVPTGMITVPNELHTHWFFGGIDLGFWFLRISIDTVNRYTKETQVYEGRPSRFIPKLVPVKNTLRVRHRHTPCFDTPVVTGLGEVDRQKILIHQVFDRSVKDFTFQKFLVKDQEIHSVTRVYRTLLRTG